MQPLIVLSVLVTMVTAILPRTSAPKEARTPEEQAVIERLDRQRLGMLLVFGGNQSHRLPLFLRRCIQHITLHNWSMRSSLLKQSKIGSTKRRYGWMRFTGQPAYTTTRIVLFVFAMRA
ncbi:hypothetical protein Cob_v009779 [Colletotrichum orbiculare MAFF 240422]|uniref:Secreted protein n=1 Tax=Colletotrichum orbiculare (strain 104-T / ATCC 96160 / CBS 514.97 / LARS 414 / MAFF 240422) TaxID=1213857 RepID=A0A484FIA2_COLOR|nr:hypothetical protein Cob_v009779 [Colletotrichum orbiculare MAFF 240422]